MPGSIAKPGSIAETRPPDPLAATGQRIGKLGLPDLGVTLGDRRLAVSGLVLVEHALARGLVELPAGGMQRRLGLAEVPLVRGLAELTDGRAQRGLDRLVSLACLLVLLIALYLRLCVGHAWESFEVSWE